MADVVIFGGTAEGRELAEYGAGLGIQVLASVVTDYGQELLRQDSCLSVRRGALDRAGMVKLLAMEQPRLVLDATHPHAAEASGQIEAACEAAGVDRQRVIRPEADAASPAEGEFWVDTPEEAIRLLKQDGRPVLLTTGSKELPLFVQAPHLAGRIYARVLPDSRVLAACEALGIRGRQLIAMQGPFSAEMNRALIRDIGAGWMVTKESGSRGGFPEKREAARACGIPLVVIRRPREETGITVDQAKRLLEKLAGKEKDTPSEGKRRLCLIGTGMGGGRQLTWEALEALAASDAVLGAPRMLEDVKEQLRAIEEEKGRSRVGDVAEGTSCGETRAGETSDIRDPRKERESFPLYMGKDILPWLREHPNYSQVSVVYSGDTGFYSGSASLLRLLEEEPVPRLEVQVFPGISTVSALCARFRLSWEGMYLASAHGRSCDMVDLLSKHPRVFLLLGGEETVPSLCRKLTDAGYGDARVYGGARLGYSDEKLLFGRAAELTERTVDALSAVIIMR